MMGRNAAQTASGEKQGRVIGLIPARGGSKRLPGKNLRCVGGVSLVARAVESARAALRDGALDEVVLTTDSDEIRHAVEAENSVGFKCSSDEDVVCVMRPPALADDTAEMVDVVLHAAHVMKLETADVVVLLQPTSPFRSAATIRRAVELFRGEARGNPVVSVSRVTLPEHAFAVASGTLRDAEVVTPNGCVYVASVGFLRLYRTWTLLATPLVLTGDEELDIDTRDDWIRARVLAGEHIPSDPYGNYLLPPSEQVVEIDRVRCDLREQLSGVTTYMRGAA